MNKHRIAIIREGKIPNDKRAPLTPAQAATLTQRFSDVELVIQTSKWRCFSDAEYEANGLRIVEDVTDCDILLGIKEVPLSALQSNKTYLFFSHTLKKQSHNQKLLKEVLRKRVRLIDYEALRDKHGIRLIAFGKYAGIVGAYNALLLYGKKYGAYKLKRAFECGTLDALHVEMTNKIRLPTINIVLTGGGRVGQGASSILDYAGIKKVSPAEFLNTHGNEPRYVQLESVDYYERRSDQSYDREDFHNSPENYRSTFLRYASRADLFIAGAFWDSRAPLFFTRDQVGTPNFKLRIVADISCDLNGPIPSTSRASSIHDPFYDYNRFTGKTENAFSNIENITVMAIDNLPCEIPKEASSGFGEILLEKIMPRLLNGDPEGVIQDATIANNGELTSGFGYLQDYVSS